MYCIENEQTAVYTASMQWEAEAAWLMPLILPLSINHQQKILLHTKLEGTQVSSEDVMLFSQDKVPTVEDNVLAKVTQETKSVSSRMSKEFT